MAGSQGKIEDLPDGEPPPKGKKTSTRTRSRSNSGDTKFKARLNEVFERIAVSLEERGDDELATIMREDGPVMATGLTSLTSLLSPLRLPLIVALAVVEPVLAFGRLFRVLAGRFVAAREQRAYDRAVADAERQDGPEPEPAPWTSAGDGAPR